MTSPSFKKSSVANLYNVIWRWRLPGLIESLDDIAIQRKIYKALRKYPGGCGERKLLLLLLFPFLLNHESPREFKLKYLSQINSLFAGSSGVRFKSRDFLPENRRLALRKFGVLLTSSVKERPDFLLIIAENKDLFSRIDLVDVQEIWLSEIEIDSFDERLLGLGYVNQLQQEFILAAENYVRVVPCNPLAYYSLALLLVDEEIAERISQKWQRDSLQYLAIPESKDLSGLDIQFRYKYGTLNPLWNPWEQQIVDTVVAFFRGEIADVKRLCVALAWVIKADRIGVVSDCLEVAGRAVIGDGHFFEERLLMRGGQCTNFVYLLWKRLHQAKARGEPDSLERLIIFYSKHVGKLQGYLSAKFEQHKESCVDDLLLIYEDFDSGIETVWPIIVDIKSMLVDVIAVDAAKLLRSVTMFCRFEENPSKEQILTLFRFVFTNPYLDSDFVIEILDYVTRHAMHMPDIDYDSFYRAQMLLVDHLMVSGKGVIALAKVRVLVYGRVIGEEVRGFYIKQVEAVEKMFDCYKQFNESIVVNYLQRMRLAITARERLILFLHLYKEFTTMVQFIGDAEVVANLRQTFVILGDYFRGLDVKQSDDWQALYCCAFVANDGALFDELQTSTNLARCVLRDDYLDIKLQVKKLRSALNDEQKISFMVNLFSSELDREERLIPFVLHWLRSETDCVWLSGMVQDSTMFARLQDFFSSHFREGSGEYEYLLERWRTMGVEFPKTIRESRMVALLRFYPQPRSGYSTASLSDSTISSEGEAQRGVVVEEGGVGDVSSAVSSFGIE